VSLRDELMKVKEDHGVLTPEYVVEAARPDDSPLHSRFQWDDAVAGEAWRREQARQLIQSVRIVYRKAAEGEPAGSIRAFHAVRGQDGCHFEAAEDVIADPFMRALVLEDMRREWQQMADRYKGFEEFWQMVAESVSVAA
jgi:hypothetical protein